MESIKILRTERNVNCIAYYFAYSICVCLCMYHQLDDYEVNI